jgi:hypothetical protein
MDIKLHLIVRRMAHPPKRLVWALRYHKRAWWVGRLDCKGPRFGPIHSGDRIMVHRGTVRGERMCGFHASWI